MDHNARLPSHTLVIEDHDLVRARLMSWLSARGHRVRACDAGDLAGLDDVGGDDLVVLDLCLGEHDGIEVLHHLAKRRFAGDVVLISAFSDAVIEMARVVGRDLGLSVIGGLRKPLALDQLDALIGETGHGAAIRRGTPTRRADAPSLTEALSNRQILFLAQPIFDARSMRPLALELLARWRDGDERIASVGPLISAAPTAALHDLAYATVDAAIALTDTLARQGLPPLPLALNVPASFVQRGHLDALTERIGQRRLPLTLEVSERDPFVDVREARAAATSAALRGWRFSLDDFGTINSNVDRLMQLPFSEVKIDRAFVQDLAHDSFADIVCRYAIRLARMRGALVVAEGVESLEDFEHLRALSVDRVQGYLLCPPLGTEALVAWLADPSRSAFVSNADVTSAAEAGAPVRIPAPSPPSEPAAETESGSFTDRLATLKARFLDRCTQDAAQIRALRLRLGQGEAFDREILRLLTHTTHGLSGAAGIFGFESISDAAHRAEVLLRDFDERPGDIDGPLDALEAELATLAEHRPNAA